ncbi:hypothetical protein NP493_481g00001 [Ridgeia piscesae]|uniref:Uncharacterized protein n=1 Tax=Ridgeia piscesae TaxID=27915 RepID=A0AAD9KYE2_RIDPI|nr:hypothetical protein NP493_481g00001 [Ridgeia piscesae]
MKGTKSSTKRGALSCFTWCFKHRKLVKVAADKMPDIELNTDADGDDGVDKVSMAGSAIKGVWNCMKCCGEDNEDNEDS